LRACRITRNHGTKRFASWPGTVDEDDDTSLLRDATIDRRRCSEAHSAADEWAFYVPLFNASLPRGRLVMRRKVNGKWHYRSPTPEEEADYVASEGW
jgi:hypothetical protein